MSLPDVLDRSGDSRVCPRRVKEPSRKSSTVQGTLREVRDGSGDPRGDPGWVGVSRVGPGRVKRPLGKSRTGRGPFQRTGTGRWILGEVRDGSEDPEEVRDGSEETR